MILGVILLIAGAGCLVFGFVSDGPLQIAMLAAGAAAIVAGVCTMIYTACRELGSAVTDAADHTRQWSRKHQLGERAKHAGKRAGRWLDKTFPPGEEASE